MVVLARPAEQSSLSQLSSSYEIVILTLSEAKGRDLLSPDCTRNIISTPLSPGLSSLP